MLNTVLQTSFAALIVDWQKKHGRHHLPWQGRDAYGTWVSEIMLQQTQVATVIPYYLRFLDRFPDVSQLAQAPVDDVMAYWSGLGYYSRARHLHRCAQIVMRDFGGVFPDSSQALVNLPGIGPSTAAAIAVFVHGEQAAILDGNVKRILVRVWGIAGILSDKQVEARLWALAKTLLPKGKEALRIYTQGLMDMGATVCTRQQPKCHVCPLALYCVAYQTQQVSVFPTKKIKIPLPIQHLGILVLCHQGHVLLQRRPLKGIWGGLWSLPEWVCSQKKQVDAIQTAHEQAACWGTYQNIVPLDIMKHAFTHYKLVMYPFLCELIQKTNKPVGVEDIWHPLDKYDKAPLPAPVRRLLKKYT